MSRSDRFRRASMKAVADEHLRGNLTRAAGHFRANHDKGFGALSADQAEAYRLRIRRARRNTLAKLPELLERLEAKVTALGGTVHWAADAAEAREIIGRICREAGAHTVVKGKSMITEEIALNPHLESLGLKVWETDLGEFIVQLGGEAPSHILAPAVHLSREQISKLFADKLGKTSESPEELTHMAREVLREQFLNADVCITGANQVVAETGTVVLFENEGNIRMGTTCARTHIAVMSLEKVAETWEDAAAVMQMLPRSATGQGLSTYVSAITGARREGERDGARDFHLVILDNGRSRLMADPVLREALCCVRCGSCLNVCPVYQTVGGFTYGWVYSGPIGQLLTPLIGPEGRGDDLPFACTLCGACAETCPVGIDHPKLFLELRRQLSEGERDRAPAVERLALGAHTALALHPGLYRAAVGTMRALNPGLGLAERCIPAIARFARRRCLPRLRRPFRARYKGPGSGSSNAQGGGHE